MAIKDYLGGLHKAIYRHEKAIEKAEIKIKQATKVYENIESTNGVSDTELRLHNLCEIGYETEKLNPVYGTKSSDPVYRKISKMSKLCGQVPIVMHWGVDGIIRQKVVDLQYKIESRKMPEEEYLHIHKSSIPKLFEEWVEQIKKECNLEKLREQFKKDQKLCA